MKQSKRSCGSGCPSSVIAPAEWRSGLKGVFISAGYCGSALLFPFAPTCLRHGDDPIATSITLLYSCLETIQAFWLEVGFRLKNEENYHWMGRYDSKLLGGKWPPSADQFSKRTRAMAKENVPICLIRAG